MKAQLISDCCVTVCAGSDPGIGLSKMPPKRAAVSRLAESESSNVHRRDASER